MQPVIHYEIQLRSPHTPPPHHINNNNCIPSINATAHTQGVRYCCDIAEISINTSHQLFTGRMSIQLSLKQYHPQRCPQLSMLPLLIPQLSHHKIPFVALEVQVSPHHRLHTPMIWLPSTSFTRIATIPIEW